jgi:hypothetical protein
MAILRPGTPTSICCRIEGLLRPQVTAKNEMRGPSRVSSGVAIYTVAKWMGDRVDVVEKSYGYLAPNTGEINKVA